MRISAIKQYNFQTSKLNKFQKTPNTLKTDVVEISNKQVAFGGLNKNILKHEAKSLQRQIPSVVRRAQIIKENFQEISEKGFDIYMESLDIKKEAQKVYTDVKSSLSVANFSHIHSIENDGMKEDWEEIVFSRNLNGDFVIEAIDEDDIVIAKTIANDDVIVHYHYDCEKDEDVSFVFDSKTAQLLKYAKGADLTEVDYNAKEIYEFNSKGLLESYSKGFKKNSESYQAKERFEFTERENLSTYFKDWKKLPSGVETSKVEYRWNGGYHYSWAKDSCNDPISGYSTKEELTFNSDEKLVRYTKDNKINTDGNEKCALLTEFNCIEEADKISKNVYAFDSGTIYADKIFEYEQAKPLSCIVEYKCFDGEYEISKKEIQF